MRTFRAPSSRSSFGAVILLLLCSLSEAFGQVDRAGLSGTVTDPTGKVVPQVRVAAILPDTGLRRETVTSAEGEYDIPELPSERTR